MTTTIKLTTIKLTRAEDGTIDVNATCDAAYEHVCALAEAEETSAAQIGAAVNAAFDKFLGKALPMDAVSAIALATMGVAPENYASQQKAVKEFIRNTPAFKVNKGKKGGVVRLADQPEKA